MDSVRERDLPRIPVVVGEALVFGEPKATAELEPKVLGVPAGSKVRIRFRPDAFAKAYVRRYDVTTGQPVRTEEWALRATKEPGVYVLALHIATNTRARTEDIESPEGRRKIDLTPRVKGVSLAST